ncbi:CaiB/BaiF CoA transferase family protein [Streptomyces spiramenti]|uniref:CoA transferase n=1 Tax=Streptomyces spiramenti TaxID=2720606 RepID=A0ABX1AF89_9ACTN|nr:CaiB/BaiF CoA-transferase family protein [Streptomyces spiramenti]NJP65774.1 CoA transferase [Streptomyces spiramenti]
MPTTATGPLAGVRVVELAGLGPAPFAAMLLADLGADVVRVDRPGGSWPHLPPDADLTGRNKRSVLADLKTAEGAARVLELAERADVMVEGFRPGVAERLGVGPEAALARNPRLVYGRMTGWGQDGPLAERAGHDIDFLALTGALAATGPADGPPVAPANLLGDHGGGALYLVVGVLAALRHAEAHGVGQVVDAAVVDGVSHLTTALHGLLAAGVWQDRREANLLDGGAPSYGCYATSDGGYMAVGALEPAFYEEFLRRLGIDPGLPAADGHAFPDRTNPGDAPRLRALLAARFSARTRNEWAEVFADSDACVAPVLSLSEAPGHPHLAARGTFTDHGGTVQPAPAPRFSVTPAALRLPPARPGADAAGVAAEWDLPVERGGTTRP